AETSSRDTSAEPLLLKPLTRSASDQGIAYRFVSIEVDRDGRTVQLTVTADSDASWPLTAARELDDALCHLRFNEPQLGTIVIRTRGDVDDVLIHDDALVNPKNHGERETALLWKRVLSRLDLTARSLIATVDPGSCFSGVLAELAFAADRTYMLDGVFEDDDSPLPAATICLTPVNAGPMPMANGISRVHSRLWGRDEAVAEAYASAGETLLAADALRLELVTITPDDLDWEDEVRVAVEERASFSPDALTGMEANHRFCGPENMATKIFSRLTAWQNWIFTRPNSTGPTGALPRYGTGVRPEYNFDRT
ncbi:MAG: hypothetical protein V3V01_04710, partial [Acidimicrobiales bacterium]